MKDKLDELKAEFLKLPQKKQEEYLAIVSFLLKKEKVAPRTCALCGCLCKGNKYIIWDETDGIYLCSYCRDEVIEDWKSDGGDLAGKR